jgi:hypothetical protein
MNAQEKYVAFMKKIQRIKRSGLSLFVLSFDYMRISQGKSKYDVNKKCKGDAEEKLVPSSQVAYLFQRLPQGIFVSTPQLACDF